MKVFVKCFAKLAKANVCDYRETTPYALPEGAMVKDLIEKLGLQLSEVKLIFINNLIVSESTILHNQDRVALSPATGGM